MHIGPAIAVLFFNDLDFMRHPKCYLLPKAVDRLGHFLPLVEELVKGGTSPFVALVMLNLLEIAPQPEHLALIVSSADIWLESYADYGVFWVDHGVGLRLCLVIDSIRAQAPALLDPDKPVRRGVDRLLTAMVSLGVAEARRLEESLDS